MKSVIRSSVLGLVLFACAHESRMPDRSVRECAAGARRQRSARHPAAARPRAPHRCCTTSMARSTAAGSRAPSSYRRPQRALGINALDDVPDSTWFTNRIGVRDLSLDELRSGPDGVGSPEDAQPVDVDSTKVGGATVGFIITDARGKKFLLKFDRAGYPETETATHMIVGRFSGRSATTSPRTTSRYFERADFVVAPDATKGRVRAASVKYTATELGKRARDRGANGRRPAPRARLALPAGQADRRASRRRHASGRSERSDPAPAAARSARGRTRSSRGSTTADIQGDQHARRVGQRSRRTEAALREALLARLRQGARWSLAVRARYPATAVEYSFDAPAMCGLVRHARLSPAQRGRIACLRRSAASACSTTAHYDPANVDPNTPAYLPILTADRVD